MTIRRFLRLQQAAVKSLFVRPTRHNEVLPEWVEVAAGPLAGMQMYISPMFGAMAKGTYEDFIYHAIERHELELDNATVWDVGAHIGYHTMAFSKLVGPAGKVCAFEPNPYHIDRLKKHLEANLLDNTNITVYEFVLSDADGTHPFRLSSQVDNTSSSGSYLNYGSLPSHRYPSEIYDSFEEINIPIYKPDTLVFESGIPVPNLIKLDIEAAEVRFLRGAARLIDGWGPTLIIEVHNIQNLFFAYEILAQHRYQLYLLDDSTDSNSRCFILAMRK